MPTAPVAHRATAQRTATRAKPAVKPATKRAARQQDAVALLRADHKKVDGLFEDYKKARSVNVKRRLVETICRELTVHTTIEEEIFYPAVKIALKDKELVPEARVEHGSIKDLIAQVQGQEPVGEDFDARIQVMSEFVKHHVKEEQTEMFPKARKTKLDLVELGRQMAERKQQLMGH